MNEINGNTRFTAIQDADDGAVFLAFYEKQEDIGTIEKAIGQIRFESWEKYREFITLQAVLFTRLDRNLKANSLVAANGN